MQDADGKRVKAKAAGRGLLLTEWQGWEKASLEAAWESWLAAGNVSLEGVGVVLCLRQRHVPAPWLDEGRAARLRQPLQELLEACRVGENWQLRASCALDGTWSKEQLQTWLHESPKSALDAAAESAQTEVIAPLCPIPLSACEVGKLWGCERWFTGSERRGSARVGETAQAPWLQHALDLLPQAILGSFAGQPPILLKVLEPHAAAAWGDLYLEVHREKWEVYLVLGVDSAVWPDNRGELLCGPLAEALQQLDADALRQQLRHRIRAYEGIRRTIDTQLEQVLADVGGIAQADLPARQHAQSCLPAEWLQEEQHRRKAVESLLAALPLQRGDVVTLPPTTLHSLRAGIRVLEFQTPTYERLIAMSSQKVLTQPHWDTQAALQLANMQPISPAAKARFRVNGVQCQSLADFPQFTAHRCLFEPGQRTQFPHAECYQLLFVAHGQGSMQQTNQPAVSLSPNHAWLLPQQMPPMEWAAAEDSPLELVFAQPKPAAHTPSQRQP